MRILAEQTEEILKTILARISDLHTNGSASLVFDLPDSFPGPFEPEDSQLYVYSQLIEKLEEREFEVSITLTPAHNTITVTWSSLFDVRTKERMKSVILRHLPKK